MSPPRSISALEPHQSLRVDRFVAPLAHQATRPAAHPHATICLCLSGSGVFWMGCGYRVQPGHLILVPEGAAHGLQESKDLELLGLSICGSAMAPPWGPPLRVALEAVQAGAPAVKVLGHQHASVQGILEQLQSDLDGGAQADELAAQGALCQLTAQILRAQALPTLSPEKLQSQWVAQALAFLQRGATQGVGLQAVAEHVGRAPNHVASTIKARTGRTVMEWVIDARMANSRRLLSQSDANIEQIANRCGYKSPSHFQRSFRRAHGMSPGKWRALHRS